MPTTTIYYHHPKDSLEKQVTGGMFGTATALDANTVRFNPDPLIARCSTSLSALHTREGLTLEREEVLALEAASPDAERVLKAVLTEGLRNKWRDGFNRVAEARGIRLDRTEALDMEPRDAARLQGIPGLGSVPKGVLASALRAESQIALAGTDRILEELKVAPVWLRVRLPIIPLEWNWSTQKWGLVADSRLDEPVAPASMAQSAVFEQVIERRPGEVIAHPDMPEQHSGYFDAVVDLPFFLPLKRGGFMGLGALQSPEGLDAVAAAREALSSLIANPAIFTDLVAHSQVQSAQLVQAFPQIERLAMNWDDEEDDFEDDDEFDDEDDGDNTNLDVPRP